MGTFSHPITLVAPSGATETLEAAVDTGSTFTVIPAPVLDRLGVKRERRVRMRLASGEVVEWDLGEVTAELDGQRSTIICVFGAPESPPLIGAHTLEGFVLGVDPVEKKLVPKEAWLLHSRRHP